MAIRALRLKESRFREVRGTRSRLREAPLAENESEWPAQYPRDVWQAVEGLACLHSLETVDVRRRIGANLKALLDEVS